MLRHTSSLRVPYGEVISMIAVGVLMIGINIGTMYVLVQWLAIVPCVAGGVRTIASPQIRFGLHRFIVYRRGIVYTLKWWQQWWRYMASKVAFMLPSMGFYWMLCNRCGVHYMLALCMNSAVIGVLQYCAGRRLVFKVAPRVPVACVASEL